MRSVLLLEDSEDLRDSLAQLLRLVAGANCVALGSFKELTLHEREALESDVALLDVNLGQGRPSGIDVYDWLRDRHYRGRVVFLTGHAESHPLVKQALASGARVLEKPCLPEDLEAAIAAGAP